MELQDPLLFAVSIAACILSFFVCIQQRKEAAALDQHVKSFLDTNIICVTVLINGMAIMDILFSVAIALSPSLDERLCEPQGFLLEWFLSGSIFFTWSIAVSLLMSTLLEEYVDDNIEKLAAAETIVKVMTAILTLTSVGIPLGWAIWVLEEDGYAQTAFEWCWISDHTKRLALLYVPLGISIGFNVLVLLITCIKTKDKPTTLITRCWGFIIVSLVIWPIPFVDRLVSDLPYFLKIVHAFAAPVQGFGNFVVYVLCDIYARRKEKKAYIPIK